MRTVSIVIPAYNEGRFIGALLDKILSIDTEAVGFKKEVVVVDDGSSDNTLAIAQSYPQVRSYKQVPNQGKGQAVQRGIRESTGDYVLVQDADLEYDPDDYIPMLKAIGAGELISVYGSRTLGQRNGGSTLGKHPDQSWGPWFAGAILSVWTFLLYGRWITDTLTGYKIYPSEVIKSFNVKTRGFETDHELTGKLIRRGVKIVEVPVSYKPRSRAEGKKIKFSDGLIAVWTLFKFRFVR